MKKSNCLFAVALCGIFLTGCLGGNLISDTLSVPNRDIGMTFNCKLFNVQDNGTHDVLDDPINLINGKKLGMKLNNRYPSIFNNSSTQSIPISVRMKQRAEDLGGLAWVVVPQSVWLFCTLGILPAYFPTMDFIYDVEVDFNSKWGKKIFSATTVLTLHENYWIGSCPFFYAFYSPGKIATHKQQRILEYRGNPLQFNSMKSDFIADSISDTITHLILENRRDLMLKVLLAEVENRWGILVGYETENALFATDDARMFQKALVAKSWNRSRIRTLAGKKALKNDLEGALENYLGNAKNNDIILLFMSGEIYQDSDRPDDVYFVCADTNKREVWTGYKLSEIFASLKEARTSNVIIMLDVCRKAYSKEILTENYLRRLEPLSNWLIISNETTLRPENASSGQLVKMLLQGETGKADLDGDKIVSLRELTAWLRKHNVPNQNLIIINPSDQSKLLDYPLSNK